MKNSGSKCILVVDDSKLFLFLSETIFKRVGSKVITATSGMQALKLVEEVKPDIVILDLMMPDMRGDEVCAKIKSDPKTKDIPVIIVTVYSNSEEIEKCMKAGCDDFLIKPIDQNALIRKVAEILKIPHRKQVRILVRIDVKGKSGSRSFFGTTENLSEGGMFLVMENLLEPRITVSLRFFLPGTRTEINAKAEILRVDKESYKNLYGYGLRFTDINEEDLKAIRQFIASRLATT